VNSSNTLNKPLGVGTHTFYIFGDWDRGTSQDTARGLNWALRLVFDGHPMSGFITGTAGQQDLAGFTEENESSVLFASNLLLPSFAGSLLFSAGPYDVELTDFNITVVDKTGFDRVSPYSVAANGRDDAVGSFTLRVTDTTASPVPEPQTIWLIGLGLVALARARRRINAAGMV
jgi:hypothetical protein